MAFIGAGLGAAARVLPRTARFASSTSPVMALKKGDKVPADVNLMVLDDGKPSPVSAASVFAGKKTVMLSIPGALTPTCQDSHVPSFLDSYDDLKAKGVDQVVCLAVNDPFVLKAFSDKTGATDKITMLGDGGAALVKKLGMEVDTGDFGGVRAKRGSFIVDDGVFTEVNLEEATGYDGPSKVETILAQL